MRIRSALAAAALGVALTAAGAATATAADGSRYVDGGENAVCSPYFGGIDTSSSDLFWGGAHCEGDFSPYVYDVNRHHGVGHDRHQGVGHDRHHGGDHDRHQGGDHGRYYG